MNYVHIILPSKRMMNTYVKMIRDYFPAEEHTFMFLNRCVGEDRELFSYGNVIEIPKTRNKFKQAWYFYRVIGQFDHIIWHGLIYDHWKMLLIFISRGILKKSTWIMRGIDLCNFELEEESIKNKFLNYINYRVRKQISNVVAIFDTDKEIYNNKIDKNKEVNIINYPIGLESFIDMESMKDAESRSNGSIWVLNGNNAYTFNRHEEVLNLLEKFSNENIRVFMPLSYGNDWANIKDNYKEKVIKKLKEKFNDKGCPILKLMPINEYNIFLANIDVAFINSNRQNALGNILRLLYIGSKVYLAKDNPVYSYLNREGIKVYAINDIINESFDEFKMNNSDSVYNRKWIAEKFHPSYNVIQWKQLFDKISGVENGIYTMEEIKDKAMNDTKFERNNEKYCKKNYIYLRRYTSKKSNKNNRDIIVLGSGDLALSIAQNVFHRKNRGNKFIFKGFLSKEKDSIEVSEYLGSYYHFNPNDKDYFICAIDDPFEREHVIELMQKKNSIFAEYIEDGVSIGAYATLGKNAVLVDQAKIGMHCKVGDFVLLQGCIIKSRTKIGRNVVIKSNSVIGSNVIIEDNVIVNENVIVSDGARITNNSIILAGSIVKN